MPEFDVSIIITCGPGMAAYLPDAVESAQRQSVRCEVIVVFDKCTPPVSFVRMDTFISVRCEHGNVQRARREGLSCAHGRAIVFLDADNRLSPRYCEDGYKQLLDASSKDPRVCGIYPRIDYWDINWLAHSRSALKPPEWSRQCFERHPGFLDASALVYRHALDVSWTETVGHQCLEDHHMWSQLVRDGWTFERGLSQVCLNYRVRANSMSATEHAKDYATRFALHDAPVTHFISISGGPRMLLWPQLRDWLLKTDRKHPIVICDASGDDETWNQLSRSMGMLLATHDDVRLYRQAVPRPGLANEQRRLTEREVNLTVARIYNRMAQEVTTPLVMVLEDDMLPPGEPGPVLRTLINGLTDRVSAVSGLYYSRETGKSVCWKSGSGRALQHITDGDLQRTKGAYLPVAGTGFGSLLIRREALRAIPQAVTESDPWYDARFFRLLAEQHQDVTLAKSLKFGHRSLPATRKVES